MEEALFLTRFASKVTLIHRREEFRASKIMLDRLTANPKIASSSTPSSTRSSATRPSRGCGCATRAPGPSGPCRSRACSWPSATGPNTALFAGVLETDERGYLVVRDETGSSVEGVFVAGDVHDHRYRQAVTAAGDGARAAIDAERWLEARGIVAGGDRATAGRPGS